MHPVIECRRYVSSLWRGWSFGGRCSRFFYRLSNPVSLPEELCSDLGLSLKSSSFHSLISQLCHPRFRPCHLTKFMPREKAEKTFSGAVHRERFPERTLCSYYFGGGWLEFTLIFDHSDRLRRLYVEHKDLQGGTRIEIPLRLLCLQAAY
ncbi:MAG: hypothetical protein KDK78_05210 [Chlamydiia bacterium]|nr:hypothetical protein [Chlamydiia bacterium]